MRLSPVHVEALKRLAAETAGLGAWLRLLGSRLDDATRGGDADLLLEPAKLVAEPVMLATRLAAQAGMAMDERKVDVLPSAPNLKQLPIHEVAERGVLL